MKIDYYPYTLNPISAMQNPRHGALLRFHFKESTGFADLHPWPELGDLNLEQQLELLKNGIETPQVQQSCSFAQLDAQARNSNISLFNNLDIPKSHWLCNDISTLDQNQISHILHAGFTHIKIKVGRKPTLEAEILPLLASSPLTVTLDANAKFTKESCLDFLDKIYPLIPKIEYIEDPTPFDPSTWTFLQTLVPLAADRYAIMAAGRPEIAKYIVIKPAIMTTPVATGQKIIYTTYLDHPVGIASAAYTASINKCTETCGLLSHLCYQPNEFYPYFSNKGPILVPPSGCGLGFEPLLNSLHWRTLK